MLPWVPDVWVFKNCPRLNTVVFLTCNINVGQYCPFQLVELEAFRPLQPSDLFVLLRLFWSACLFRMSLARSIRPSGPADKDYTGNKWQGWNVLLWTSNSESHVWYIDTKVIPGEGSKIVDWFNLCMPFFRLVHQKVGYVYQYIFQRNGQNSHGYKDPQRALTVTYISEK